MGYGLQVEALIDTGSAKSFLSKSVYAAIVVPKLNKLEGGDVGTFSSTASDRCISVTGQALHITGVFDGSVTLHDSSISYFHRFVVCNNMLSPLQCILGWDFIQANRL